MIEAVKNWISELCGYGDLGLVLVTFILGMPVPGLVRRFVRLFGRPDRNASKAFIKLRDLFARPEVYAHQVKSGHRADEWTVNYDPQNMKRILSICRPKDPYKDEALYKVIFCGAGRGSIYLGNKDIGQDMAKSERLDIIKMAVAQMRATQRRLLHEEREAREAALD